MGSISDLLFSEDVYDKLFKDKIKSEQPKSQTVQDANTSQATELVS